MDMDDGLSNDGIDGDPALDGCVVFVVRCTYRIDVEWLLKVAVLEGPPKSHMTHRNVLARDHFYKLEERRLVGLALAPRPNTRRDAEAGLTNSHEIGS